MSAAVCLLNAAPSASPPLAGNIFVSPSSVCNASARASGAVVDDAPRIIRPSSTAFCTTRSRAGSPDFAFQLAAISASIRSGNVTPSAPRACKLTSRAARSGASSGSTTSAAAMRAACNWLNTGSSDRSSRLRPGSGVSSASNFSGIASSAGFRLSSSSASVSRCNLAGMALVAGPGSPFTLMSV